MTEQQYFVRWRGQLTGPFDLNEVKEMVVEGRLSRLHDVSCDRSDWRRAGTLAEFFPPYTPKPKTIPDLQASDTKAASTNEPVAAIPVEEVIAVAEPIEEEADEWYYSMNGITNGPFTASAMEQFIRDGVLTPDAYIRSGFEAAEWSPVLNVPRFAQTVAGGVGMGNTGLAQSTFQVPVALRNPQTLASSAVKLTLVGIVVPICGLVGLVWSIRARRDLTASGIPDGRGLAATGIAIGILDVFLDLGRLVLLAWLTWAIWKARSG